MSTRSAWLDFSPTSLWQTHISESLYLPHLPAQASGQLSYPAPVQYPREQANFCAFPSLHGLRISFYGGIFRSSCLYHQSKIVKLSKVLDDFKRPLHRDQRSVFYVLYVVTFGTSSPTALYNYASHSLTDHLGENITNVMTSISRKRLPNSNICCCTTRHPFFVCIMPLRSVSPRLQLCIIRRYTFQPTVRVETL